MLKISEIYTKKQFNNMRKCWNVTLNKSLENNIFLTWEKMAPSVNLIEKESTLKILCASEETELIGIAPFRKTRKSLKGNFGYNIIEPLTNGNTDYSGLLITKQEVQCVQKFLTHLFQQKDWDLITIPDLPQASPTLELIKLYSKELPRFKVEKGVICPYVEIPDSEEDLLSSLKPKFRRNLQRRLRKLEKEQGNVEIKHYYELGSLENAMQIFFRLHQKRWIRKGESGVFEKQKAREITMQTTKFFAERNWLRLHFLTVNNRPVAASLDLEYGGKMYGHLAGFDPDYSKYSVGNILLLKILNQCVKKELSEYDFMQGDESYKFDWTQKYRQNMNVKFFNRKFSSMMISLGLMGTQLIDLCYKELKKVKNLKSSK
ncbi:GNAT family N-acetyltransferase [Candidatus Bathyarchaeota archaeon]|nr:GNAT family N-acetyltransferase [Candidatus Bathyarchaeota archaeon]